MGQLAGFKGDVWFTNGYNANPYSWSLEDSSDVLDVTSFETTGPKSYIAGLRTFTGTIEYYLDTNEEPPVANVTEADMRLYVDAHTYWGGYVLVTGVSIDASTEDVVTLSIEFQGSGSLNRASYSTGSAPQLVTNVAYSTVSCPVTTSLPNTSEPITVSTQLTVSNSTAPITVTKQVTVSDVLTSKPVTTSRSITISKQVTF